MKAKTRRRMKRLWNKRTRRHVTTCRQTAKLTGRQVGGQWVERKSSRGGLVID